MAWLLAAIVGALLGALLYVIWSRRRLRRQPGVFACRVRPGGPLEGSDWQRTKRYGTWVHDVLIVHKGPCLTRYEALPVATLTGPITSLGVKGLGERPVWVRLHLDDGRLIDVAARNGDVSAAIGPYVAASMRG